MIKALKDKKPLINQAAFIAWNATISGEVKLEKDSSVWYGVSLRADMGSISIGQGTNIQDNTTVHVDFNASTKIGEYVVVGHNCILHGCTVEDGALIGMGAIVLNRAVIGAQSIVGAGALITEGKVFPPRSLIIGSPAVVKKTLTEEDVQKIRGYAEIYINLARDAKLADLAQP